MGETTTNAATLAGIVAELRLIHENGAFTSVLIPADVKRAIELSMGAIELLASAENDRAELVNLLAAESNSAAAERQTILRELEVSSAELATLRADLAGIVAAELAKLTAPQG